MKDARILVVEDEGIIGMDLRTRLATLGYAVVAVVPSGEEALQQAAEFHPDLVLMDIVLRGGMDGVQTAEQIQGRFDLPVIYLTAHSDEKTLQRARITEPYGFILKPFDDRELHSVIEMALYKHHVERKLKESDARFRLLAENSSDMIARLAPDGRYLYVSPTCRSLLGYVPEELIGQSCYAFVHSEDVKTVHDACRRLGDQSVPGIVRYRSRRKNGDYVWLESTGRAIRNLSTGEIEELQISSRDITERKQAEEALCESEERFRYMADHAPVMIWMAGEHTLCTFFNKPWLDFTGRTLAQEMGTGWAENIHPNDLPLALDTYLAAFKGRVPFRVEYRLRRADGEYRWILNTGVPRLTSEEHFAGYIGSCVDISERKEMEEKLRYLSTHDALTNLYNRAYLEAELARLEPSRQYPVSIIVADVNGLKTVNDTQGHAAGDTLLKRAAQVLRQSVRTEDIVARIGGDEFAILLPCTDAPAAEEMLERIHKRIASDNQNHADCPVALALGCATGQKGQPLSEVQKEADAAMYRNKGNGLK